MTHLHDPLKGMFLIATGSSGTLIALLRPWQEQLEWSGRMMLLCVSIISVIVGLWAATRKKK